MSLGLCTQKGVRAKGTPTHVRFGRVLLEREISRTQRKERIERERIHNREKQKETTGVVSLTDRALKKSINKQTLVYFVCST